MRADAPLEAVLSFEDLAGNLGAALTAEGVDQRCGVARTIVVRVYDGAWIGERCSWCCRQERFTQTGDSSYLSRHSTAAEGVIDGHTNGIPGRSPADNETRPDPTRKMLSRPFAVDQIPDYPRDRI
jgi:hypothetical protein